MIDYAELAVLADIAATLARIDPRVVIAGGAPRNLMTGLTIRDVDVFAPNDISHRIKEFETALNRPLALVTNIEAAGYTPAFKVYRSDDARAEVIFVEDVQDYIADFDDDLSRMYVGAEGLVVTPDALRALANKRIELVPTSDSKRAEKLLALYPDWEIVGPLS